MSQENVEIMRRAFDALNTRDTGAIPGFFDEDVEWRPQLTAGGALEGTVYRGHAGMARYVADTDDLFSEARVEVVDLREVRPDTILFRGRATARGRSSGVPLDVPIWAIWQLRDGRLHRGVAYSTEAEALEAAGLSE